MCGIVGFYDPSGFRDGDGQLTTLQAMRDRLMHRGPDDAGTWTDAAAGIAIGHRRLAVLDLTPAGHQPMISSSGRYCLSFNGEIYNHLELRKALGVDREWRGGSDTETLLAGIELWGLCRVLQASAGMFAFALWDRQSRTLTLARDRMGEKPLYYGWQQGVLLFASEAKAFDAHPAFDRRVNPSALAPYLRYGCIPAPWSVWDGIRKLIPGCTVTFTGADRAVFPKVEPYWSYVESARNATKSPLLQLTDEEAVCRLETELREAIGGQMRADVPVGAFLSGGVDSSLVVALMQAQSGKPVRTFSIGFREVGYNEAPFAAAVAGHLGTEHTEHYVTPDEAQDVVPALPDIYDEPFGDSSAIPTYIVSRLARQHVTAVLSGDGGDELFGGYARYSDTVPWMLWRTMSRLKAPWKAIAAKIDAIPRTGSRLTSRALSAAVAITDRAACPDILQYYRHRVSQWHEPPVKHSRAVPGDALTSARIGGGGDRLHQLMAFDALGYLPDDILVKVDRAAMAVSLETRVPFLDHRVVESALRMPTNLKVRQGSRKWILKELLYRYVPRHLVDRPKFGFAVPVDQWIRGPLRPWADDLLTSEKLESHGLDSGPIIRRWNEHLAGQANWRDSLWNVLMWQAWMEQNKRNQ